MLQSKKARLAIAIGYLVIISALFCLPGSAFPKSNWLSKIAFDKWIHIGFFAVLIILWNWAANSTKKNYTVLIMALAIIYGMVVELVQHNFIPNRGFDIGDWIADVAGSCIGLWAWIKHIRQWKGI